MHETKQSIDDLAVRLGPNEIGQNIADQDLAIEPGPIANVE